MICNKCKKDKQGKNDFFTLKTKEKLDICWDCLLKDVDLNDESTFVWIFELVNCPYAPHTFLNYALSSNYDIEKTFRKYLAWTKLKSIKCLGYEDSLLGW